MGSSATPVAPSSSTAPLANSYYVWVRGDTAGHVYALSTNPNTINSTSAVATVQEFSSANGVLTQMRSFSFKTAGGCCAMAADASGNVYLSDYDGNLYTFDPAANGSASPVRTVNVGYANGINSMTTDAAGNLYAKVANSTIVYKFSPGFTSATPGATLNYSGEASLLIFDVAVDASGHFYLYGYLGDIESYGVTEFNDFSGGTPTRRIYLSQQASTLLPGFLSLDSAGYVYVGEYSGTATTTSTYQGFSLAAGSATDTTDPVITFTSSVPYFSTGANGGILVQ